MSESQAISPREIIFTEFLAFVYLTKYNDSGTNTLNVLSTKDDDIESAVRGRNNHRKIMKLMDDDERLRNTSDISIPIGQRELAIDTRLQVIEMAQIEDAKAIDALTTSATLINNQLELLLN